MADRVRLVEYYYIKVPDRPGEGVKALRHLRASRVNLRAFHAFPSGGRAQLNFVPASAAALRAAARAAKWRLVGPKKAFLVQGSDRAGALVAHYDALAAAGVNVVATDAVAAGGRFGAVMWVDARDLRKAAKALRAS